MAAKLVAFVTAGYPPDALASFEGSVRAGVAREFLNGAAVVHADEAAVAAAIPAVLGEYWGTRRGPVASVHAFFREAQAAAAVPMAGR